MVITKKPEIKVDGRLIEALRLRLHLTRAEFAGKLNVDPITVWRWEKSGTKKPRPVYLQEIQRLWGFSFGKIVKEDK